MVLADYNCWPRPLIITYSDSTHKLHLRTSEQTFSPVRVLRGLLPWNSVAVTIKNSLRGGLPRPKFTKLVVNYHVAISHLKLRFFLHGAETMSKIHPWRLATQWWPTTLKTHRRLADHSSGDRPLPKFAVATSHLKTIFAQRCPPSY